MSPKAGSSSSPGCRLDGMCSHSPGPDVGDTGVPFSAVPLSAGLRYLHSTAVPNYPVGKLRTKQRVSFKLGADLNSMGKSTPQAVARSGSQESCLCHERPRRVRCLPISELGVVSRHLRERGHVYITFMVVHRYNCPVSLVVVAVDLFLCLLSKSVYHRCVDRERKR